MNLRAPFIFIVLLASPSNFYAQETPGAQKLPDGDGAWVVDLVTSGGFTGMGIGKFSVDSSGQLTCSSTKHKCTGKLSATALRSLSEKVKAAAAVPWEVPAQPGLCSDCVTGQLQLAMRQPDGSTKTFITSWDTASRGVPEELRSLSNTLIGLGK